MKRKIYLSEGNFFGFELSYDKGLIFANAGANGIYLDKNKSFYIDNTGPGGNAANVMV